MLDEAAMKGCLGGPENVPEELSNLKVRFGELESSGHGDVRRAGFGTVEEVVPLMKGQSYGRACD